MIQYPPPLDEEALEKTLLALPDTAESLMSQFRLIARTVSTELLRERIHIGASGHWEAMPASLVRTAKAYWWLFVLRVSLLRPSGRRAARAILRLTESMAGKKRASEPPHEA